MRTFVDASKLLHSLLDRIEGQPERSKRVTARPSLAFRSPEDREALSEGLKIAEAAGAVDLGWDRDAPHLVSKVTLRDADRLYRHLRRVPAVQKADVAIAALQQASSTTEEGAALAASLADAWRNGSRIAGLGSDRLVEALALVRCMDAAFQQGDGSSLPLRTRSARLLGDSKALERALPKLLSYLRQSGRLDAGESDEEALERLGLRKFAQPILVAGPIRVDGLDVSDWTYVGLPPEVAGRLSISGRAGSLLTIENLESFNRHVREVRRSDDIVLYTGGFPSSAVVAVLHRLVTSGHIDAIWHWGDIDGGGVRIGAYLERALPRPVRPHLMTETLAKSQGEPISPIPGLTLTPTSAFFALACFLSGEEARCLEQEKTDPQSPARK